MKKEAQIILVAIVFCFIQSVIGKIFGFQTAVISSITTIYWILLTIKHKDK